MFLYNLKKISIRQNVFSVESLNTELLNTKVLSLLNDFEEDVFRELKSSPNYDFKYVQSAVNGSKLFNKHKKKLPEEITVEMITQHPNYTGGILINKLIPKAVSGNNLFVLYFISDFKDSWLNSETKPTDLFSNMKQLMKISELKKDIEINLIEIFGSKKLKFIESQKGASKKRWMLKNKI